MTSAPPPSPIQLPPADRPLGQAAEVRTGFQLLPPRASSYAGQVDDVALVWTVFSAFILLLVFGMLTVFSVRYRRRGEAVGKLSKRVRYRLEWSWTIALILIAVSVGVWADWVFFKMRVPPPDATEVFVVGKQWMWKIQHADGTREIDELHVPVDEPIKLIMSSQDVIHSFYVPAFRTKQDVVPGRYSYIWFKATRPGTYRLFCAEYCGTAHSNMTGLVHVMTKADFAAWKAAQAPARPGAGPASLAARGRELFTRKGCISCHAPGGPVRAPDLNGVYMRREGLRSGEAVLADENYLRESILNPRAKIVEGYDAIMPSFQGQLSEEDLLALIEYLKSRQYGDRPGK